MSLSQPELIRQLRDRTDDLQAAVTRDEWERQSNELTALLRKAGDRWLTKMVQHNIGERRYFLARYARRRRLPYPHEESEHVSEPTP